MPQPFLEFAPLVVVGRLPLGFGLQFQIPRRFLGQFVVGFRRVVFFIRGRFQLQRLAHRLAVKPYLLRPRRPQEDVTRLTYRVKPEMFQRAAQEMVDKYTVRTETDEKIPVVAPPAGADVYLIARLWAWWPILELEKGKTYRLHLTAMDYQHGFSLQPENINVQVLPGYQHVLTITPNRSGTYAIVCNEYCGIGHHKMVSKLYVK